MRPRLAIFALLIGLIGIFIPSSVLSQTDQSDASRKVVSKVIPEYPPIARTMGIHGSVRVDVVVAPNGTVKTLEVKGGHPVLAQAAANAVRRWKWAPSTHDTKEPVTLTFDPKQ